jgi:hypothetical protein
MLSGSTVSLRLYADDTAEYYADYSPMVLNYNINKELNIIKDWLTRNKLSINTVNTQALVMGTNTYKYDLKLGDTPVEIKDSLKILGVAIDSKLTYDEHLKIQLSKAYGKTRALCRIRRFISAHVMIQLYKRPLSVLPHLEYCGPVLVGITKSLSSKLEDANYYITHFRTLSGLSKSDSYESILKSINMRTLEHRRYYQVLLLLFKCIKNKGPNYINDFFKLR